MEQNIKKFLSCIIVNVFLFVIIFMGGCLLRQDVYAEEIYNEENIENDEKYTYTTGCVEVTEEIKQSVPIIDINMDTTVFATNEVVDLSDGFPTPGSQGSQGSCTAWAVGYAAKSYLVNLSQNWGVNEHTFSPAFIFNQLNNNGKGIDIYDAMQLIVEQGVCLLSDMPYNQYDYTTQPTQQQKSLARQYRSLAVMRTEDGDVNAIKNVLKTEIPVVIGVPSYQELDYLNETNDTYDTIEEGEKTDIGHAMCLVGYDETKQAFKFINSWGTNWGLDGYGYIAYSLIERFYTTGWVLCDAKVGLFTQSEFSDTELIKYVPVGDNINSVSVPYGITTIGANAFENQTRLFNVELPNTVTGIGIYAFSGCKNLMEITLSDELRVIAMFAFQNCSLLERIEIPEKVSSIWDGVFCGCDILEIDVDENNMSYKVISNVLYDISETKIISAGNYANDFAVVETVVEVSSYAFYGNINLETLRIYGNPVIRSFAFANCENLEKVYVYSYNALEIGAGGFSGNDFIVYVPHCKQNEFANIFSNYTNQITSIPIQVTLMLNESELYQIINTYYGATIFGIEDPYQEGNTFIGWKNGDVIYNNGDTWNVTTNITVIAEFDENEPETFEYIVQLDKQCEQDADYITVTLGQPMPTADKPHRTGYSFWGYFTQVNGRGVRYYDDNMNSLRNWDIESNNVTLYAYWERENYEVVLSWGYNLNTETVYVHYGDEIVPRETPTRPHYKFAGYYSEANGRGNCYATGEVVQENGQYVMKAVSTGLKWNYESGGTLYAYWRFIMVSVPWQAINTSDNSVIGTGSVIVESGVEMDITAPTYNGKDFLRWEICGVTYSTQVITVTLELHLSPLTGEYVLCTSSGADGEMKILYQTSCVAEGTLITLADGSQVPVETLTGNEMLLVWNLHTGSFDTAPILFIDSDEAREYQIINLYFSDGTHVKVISEHGFWDFDLNRYVYLDANAGQYVGHWFNKQVTDEDGNLAWGRVQLINVTLTKEYTTALSPVTYGHLCLYVNGMLSMPGATGGLVNTFEVDGTTMRIDEQSYLADIATYGLYTYEEFAQEYDVPEEIFNAVQGQYLKVAIGKGLIDAQGINALINSYSQFF